VESTEVLGRGVPRSVAWSRRDLVPAIGPPALAVAVATLAVVLGWKGVDWPAQVYRVQLFRSYGWVGFDTGWYGGNFPLAYSVLFPPLAAALSVGVVAVGSAGAAAWAFGRLLAASAGRGGRLGSLVFAVGTIVPVAVGQLPYLLGVAFGLLALVSMRRWLWLAVAAAAACGLASPLAALFLSVAAVAAAWTGRRWGPLVVAGAAVAPVAAVIVAYHQGGLFPFSDSNLAFLLAGCAVTWLLVPADHRALRVGTALYAAAAIGVFAVRSPIGDNFTRLSATVGVPLAATIVIPLRRWLGAALLLPLLVWQWSPAVDAITASGTDASSNAAYFSPLLTELSRVHAIPGRLEIPLTRARWETARVAPTMSLARGWERQLDFVDNSIFYRPGPLTVTSYRDWLDRNGITWVALPDVALDYSAQAEARLLKHGAGFLRPVWHGAHWTLWQVTGSPGMVSGPASLVSLAANQFTVVANARGNVTVRVRYSPLWTIKTGSGCLSAGHDGWTDVRVSVPGKIRVAAGILPYFANGCE
jgi:hypothetical protein